MRWPRTDGAVAQAPQGPRPISIELATAVNKKTPVLLEGLGTVTTIASVAIRSRIDNEIVGIHFQDGAKVTKGDLLEAAFRSDQAALENLKVQLSYCTIRAPISGRISQAAVKIGNLVRSADLVPIAVINQVAPVYVSFSVAPENLPD